MTQQSAKRLMNMHAADLISAYEAVAGGNVVEISCHEHVFNIVIRITRDDIAAAVAQLKTSQTAELVPQFRRRVMSLNETKCPAK